MKKILHKILLSVNILFAFALLISYLSVHINPELFILPAFFGLAFPYLLLVNIFFSIIWAVLLRYEAIISVIVIAIGFTHLSNYIRFGKSNESTDNSFRVISYNVKLFDNYGNPDNNTEEIIIDFLKNQDADIICLQEFYLYGDPEKKDSEIKNALGDNYFSHMKLTGSGKNRYYGIATFSRYPIVQKGQIIHPRSSSLTIFSDVIIGHDTLRIFNNHLQSFRLKNMNRSFFDEMTAGDNNETFGLFKSLAASLKKGFVIRAQQAEALKTQINISEYPVIVVGDFNDTPVSWSYRKIRKGLNDSFVSAGYGAGFTYRGNYPSNRIDYILYDDALECRFFDILRVKYSDHYPVSAFFARPF